MNGGLIHWAIMNRKVTIFLVLIVVVLGLYSYYVIPKQESPDVATTIALITAVYPGASPEDMEKLVTSEIENKVKQINGFRYSESKSKNSVAVVVLYLENEIDLDKAWTDLREKMRELQNQLPAGCLPIQVDTDLAETAGIILALSSDKYSSSELVGFAEKMERELARIRGVSKVEITGEQKKEVRVTVDYQKLANYNLSMDEIVQMLKAQNMEIPSGAIDDGTTKINVMTPALFSSLKEIENLILDVSKQTGAVTRLKDTATVLWNIEEDSYKIKYMGNDAVLLTGYFADDLNIVLTGREVEKALRKLIDEIPEGVRVDKILFQPHDVQEAVDSFILNLIKGVILVIIVVFLGTNFKNSLVVSTAIPLSILMTFVVMYFFKIKVHEVSTAGLIIALGMLVDNAIVVGDSIQVKLDQRVNKLQACIEGTKETAVPVFTSTLTTIAAFLPLILIGGMSGEYIYSVPMTVIFATFSSFIIAILVIPCFAHIFFNQGSTGVSRQMRLTTLFLGLINRTLIYKKTVLTIALCIFIASIYLGMQLNLVFFPKADRNIIYFEITSEISGNINKTEKIVEQTEKILMDQEEIINYVSAIGDGLPKFYITLSKPIQSPDYAQIMARVDLSKGNRFKSNEELAYHLQDIFDKNISGGKVTARLLEQSEPLVSPVRLRVSGDNMESLIDAAEKIKESLAGVPGTINVRHDAPDMVYDYLVAVDTDKASQIGLSKYDVQSQLSIALKGYDASVYRERGKNYNILVKSNISSVEDLYNFPIKSSITGQKTLLKQIADIGLKPQRPIVVKFDGEMAVTVLSDVMPSYSSVNIQNYLESSILPKLDIEDVRLTFDGEREKIIEYFGDAGKYAVLAIFLIYFLLVVQFNSLRTPLIILFTVPLSITGSLLGLYVFNQPLSFTALLGIIALTGLVIKNAILLIEYINYSRKQGLSIPDAVKAGVDRRFKPIILSTITTVMGLFPLALSGSALFVPMSITLMSGLMVATFLTLIVIPIVYTVIEQGIADMGNSKSLNW